MERSQNKEELKAEIKKENLSGIPALVILFIVEVVTIVFGNTWFKIIGWISLGLTGLTALHIMIKYKQEKKGGSKRWQVME